MSRISRCIRNDAVRPTIDPSWQLRVPHERAARGKVGLLFILPTTKLELVLAALVHDVPHDAQRNRDEAWSQWLNTERLTSNDTQSDREDSELLPRDRRVLPSARPLEARPYIRTGLSVGSCGRGG